MSPFSFQNVPNRWDKIQNNNDWISGHCRCKEKLPAYRQEVEHMQRLFFSYLPGSPFVGGDLQRAWGQSLIDSCNEWSGWHPLTLGPGWDITSCHVVATQKPLHCMSNVRSLRSAHLPSCLRQGWMTSRQGKHKYVRKRSAFCCCHYLGYHGAQLTDRCGLANYFDLFMYGSLAFRSSSSLSSL